jgi:hypothetical protein
VRRWGFGKGLERVIIGARGGMVGENRERQERERERDAKKKKRDESRSVEVNWEL